MAGSTRGSSDGEVCLEVSRGIHVGQKVESVEGSQEGLRGNRFRNLGAENCSLGPRQRGQAKWKPPVRTP